MAREGVGETRPRDRASDGRPIRSPEVRTERRRERRVDGPHVHLPGGCVTRPRDPLPTDVTDLPPLPAGYDDVVAEGLAALGLTLDEATLAAIADHVRLLLAWTVAINLTAIREPVAAAREHVLDSLTALPLLRSRNTSDLLDIGSGGGFPGIPLALALPRARTVLVESVGKKATFLAAVLDAARAPAPGRRRRHARRDAGRRPASPGPLVDGRGARRWTAGRARGAEPATPRPRRRHGGVETPGRRASPGSRRPGRSGRSEGGSGPRSRDRGSGSR